MNAEPKYTMYGKRKVPAWWTYCLPRNQQNPYKDSDTLTLDKGCLSEFWHIHSSNKHPRPKGIQATEFAQKLVRDRFGGAFVTPVFGGTFGKWKARHIQEPDHLVYENAYLDEQGKIHIKNAKKYYNDVVNFMIDLLRQISANHLPSADYGDGEDFFPSRTDAEIIEDRKKAELRRENTALLKQKLQAMIDDESFLIGRIEFERVSFSARHSIDDGWFNEEFKFSVFTDQDTENTQINILVDFPRLPSCRHEKKDLSKAVRTCKMNYCFYLHYSRSRDAGHVTLPIPSEKIAEEVKAAVSEACNKAMKEYNEAHTEPEILQTSSGDRTRYPENIFLDNNIGNIELVYKLNAGVGTWRFGYMNIS